MALPQVSRPDAVWDAIDEYDRIGGQAFHKEYGFGPADAYLVVARDRLYDSKAILAVAQKYEHPDLGVARNDFTGGVSVQRRFETLGFEVIRDTRCGDFLKLLPGIRVGGSNGSQKVYKPLLLLVALGRAAAGKPRLAPFGEYEQALTPLLERFSEDHAGSATPNAWWRLPGDGLWEIVSDSGAILRAAGERAKTEPPAVAELRTEAGGFPSAFYDALREVPALSATGANLLVEQFFADRSADEKASLLELARSWSQVSGDAAIHLLVKWSSKYEPATIEHHRELSDRHGAVWWAVFSQREDSQYSPRWVGQVQKQLDAAQTTYVFLSGETCWQTRLQQVETEREQVEPELIPEYYDRLTGRPLFWLKISDFEPLERDDLLRLLDPANYPGYPLALANRTNPLIVRFRTRPRVWWVNQGSSFARASTGGYLWAPVLDKSGRSLDHWQTMRHLREGDVVLNYADRIRGWSRVTAEATPSPRPDPESDQEWSDDGYRADAVYHELDPPIGLGEIPNEWRTGEGGPFDKNGGVKQGYLFNVSDDFAGKLLKRFPSLEEALAATGITAARVEPRVPTPSWHPVSLDEITNRVAATGLVLTNETVRRYHLSLQTRGFVILAGVSGSGKTWLAEAYAKAVSGKALVVAVAPNWTTNEDLLGYLNPLNQQYYDTDFSRFLRAAAKEWEQARQEGRTPVPHYLVLDEMNLARVEYYFAKFLSAMERRARDDKAFLDLSPNDADHVLLPPNLYVTGTVNIDETTFGFADKVYDRAQLIEIPVSRDALSDHLAGRPYRNELLEVWDAIAVVAPFAFRVIDEIGAYVDGAAEVDVAWEQALDEQLLQKVLPKIKGTDLRLRSALTRFIEISEDRFPLSHEKALALRAAFVEHGFTEFFSV